MPSTAAATVGSAAFLLLAIALTLVAAAPSTAAATSGDVAGELQSTNVNRFHLPQAACTFSVHEKNANGAQVDGSRLRAAQPIVVASQAKFQARV